MLRITSSILCTLLVVVVGACGPDPRNGHGDDDGPGSGTCPSCSGDNTSVVDCDGNVIPCPLDMACSNGACMNACAAAEQNHSSVGCDYFPIDMDGADGPPKGGCYAVFVANTAREQVHINIDWNGQPIDLAQFAKIPTGQGMSLAYGTYDPVTGLAPGEVAILFLDAIPPIIPIPGMAVPCPVPAALAAGPQIFGTGKGHAFHMTTDLPVVAYQMLPYGGGSAAATGASLLVPSSAWGNNYIAVSAYDPMGAPIPIPIAQGPSHDIVAKEDNTMVTVRPISAIAGGGGLPAGTANQPYTFMLNKGEFAQLTQFAPLSGSPITSDKPVGVYGGHQIMSIDQCCGDHGEQALTPVQALGSEYVAAPHPDRKPGGEMKIYRIYGAVDDTALTYEPANVGPATLKLGEMHEIRTATPFVVRSQDTSHPFAMFTYMTGSGEQGQGGIGDPDFVRLIPPLQYLSHYVFFTDPTYPFTLLTVVRAKKDSIFYDVDLDCMGNITNWQPVGEAGNYEIAHISMVDHWNGLGTCNNGVHDMSSNAPFGVWVWGWGSEDTNTGWVSYGYPAGEGVLPINDVVIF